jgi:hypothetical protein
MDSAGLQSSLKDKAYVFSYESVLYFLQNVEGRFEVWEMYNSEIYVTIIILDIIHYPLFKN